RGRSASASARASEPRAPRHDGSGPVRVRCFFWFFLPSAEITVRGNGSDSRLRLGVAPIRGLLPGRQGTASTRSPRNFIPVAFSVPLSWEMSHFLIFSRSRGMVVRDDGTDRLTPQHAGEGA